MSVIWFLEIIDYRILFIVSQFGSFYFLGFCNQNFFFNNNRMFFFLSFSFFITFSLFIRIFWCFWWLFFCVLLSYIWFFNSFSLFNFYSFSSKSSIFQHFFQAYILIHKISYNFICREFWYIGFAISWTTNTTFCCTYGINWHLIIKN